MQDVKHNIDSLALMNVSIDFDELSIHVLNELGIASSHISHAIQARETSVTFKELFERLLSYGQGWKYRFQQIYRYLDYKDISVDIFS